MTPLEQKICQIASQDKTVSQIARLADCDRSVVYRCIEKYGAEAKMRSRALPRSDLKQRILDMNDGQTPSHKIADQLGCSAKYVQNVLSLYSADRLSRGARHGQDNPSYIAGRHIDLDGYALVRAPDGHPYSRKSGVMFEHRLVLEQNLGRYLLPSEVVDHIDGLHLHNDPSNLRVFASNAEHLAATIAGQVPDWSEAGKAKLTAPRHLKQSLPQVDTYRQRREAGEIRLQQILRAALLLGTDSQHLAGTHHLLERGGIDWTCRTTLERALADLSRRQAWRRAQ